MNCDKCRTEIRGEDPREHFGQILCEDCYIDVLTPAKACDPWAVHCARSFSGKEGTAPELNDNQKNILKILKETNGTDLPTLSERLQIKPADLERDMAALRHMEKLRAELRQGKKVFCLW